MNSYGMTRPTLPAAPRCRQRPPDVEHRRNIAVRREISIVVFDSRQPINTGQAVYMAAVAQQLGDDEQKRASRSSPPPLYASWPSRRIAWMS
jgi:hypothetical protein